MMEINQEQFIKICLEREAFKQLLIAYSNNFQYVSEYVNSNFYYFKPSTIKKFLDFITENNLLHSMRGFTVNKIYDTYKILENIFSKLEMQEFEHNPKILFILKNNNGLNGYDIYAVYGKNTKKLNYFNHHFHELFKPRLDVDDLHALIKNFGDEYLKNKFKL